MFILINKKKIKFFVYSYENKLKNLKVNIYLKEY